MADDHQILRVFRARPRSGCADELESLLQTTSPDLVRDRAGFLGHLAVRPAPDGTPGSEDYLFLTLWTGMDAIRGFAGERWRESVLPEGYAELLEAHSVHHMPIISRATFPADE